MANIKIALQIPMIDGQSLTFRAPCDCSNVTGIRVDYPNGEDTAFQVFSFADAHGNDLTGIGNLFAEGAMVKVVLDIASSRAFIQNADTNAYLEEKFNSKAPYVAHRFNPASAAVTAAPIDLIKVDYNAVYANSSYMWNGYVASEDASVLVNSPVSSGPFYAFRSVETCPAGHFLVTLREMYPVTGRIWTNMYHADTGWLGWQANDSSDKVTNSAAGLQDLFAAGPTILSNHQYGTKLPSTGKSGQIYFLKV